MFKKLQDKWKVNGLNLLLILFTFAIGGSLCGYAGRKILIWTNLEKNLLWFILYIILITILWPVCVLLVSYPFGQFAFFKRYLQRIWNRMKGKKNQTNNRVPLIRIAIFASGAGSNAEKIIGHFNSSNSVKVALIISNRPKAGVLQIARNNNIETDVITSQQLQDSDTFIASLKAHKIDFLILAGFLLKIPPALVQAYPKKIINIHPALLPAYGGKGMYGMHVHEAVIASGDKQSGISIHYVDELYDHGEIIFQATCDILPKDNPQSLAEKVHQLEHAHYPAIIEAVVKKQNPG